MRADPPGYAFIILLRDEGDARGLATLLAGLLRDPAPVPSRWLVPPVRGVEFFASAAEQPRLDAWWGAHVPRSHRPVYLVDHDPELPLWLAGLDGHFYIGLTEPGDARAYQGAAPVTVGSGHPLDYARLVMRDHCDPPAPLFTPDEAARLAAVAAGLGLTDPADSTREVPAADGAGAVVAAMPLLPGLRLLEHIGSTMRSHLGPSWRRVSVPSGDTSSGRKSRDRSARALAEEILHRDTTVCVIGSRKGGVGKTSYAAAIAIQAGRLLDAVGHTACLVDANLANPDAWGEMSLPVRAATVRHVVAALNANREPPPPVHAQTPALACYPEAREASEYSHTDIDRLARYLRRRYSFVIVDMSNRLPDPLGGPEAAVAAYWLEHADVLVLPTTCSKPDFNGVLDYLDVGGLPPVIVPYIVPRGRAHRDHHVARAYLAAIVPRVHAVVEIPDQADVVRQAGMENLPAENLSPTLRRAYRRLTAAVIAAPPAVRAAAP
ncbi:MAG: hypothetical protein ABR541_02905 [Candidatus Dormibacteria bacterium]